MEKIRNFLEGCNVDLDLDKVCEVFSTDFFKRTSAQSIECYEHAARLKSLISSKSFEELKKLIPDNREEAWTFPRELRDAYINFMGFSFINMDYIEKLSTYLKGKKVLEVMAGNGFLSTLLREKGVDVIITDLYPGDKNSYDIKKTFAEIEEIGAVEAIKKYGKDVDVVIMSWPPYARSIAAEVMKTIKDVNPELKVIYIGEGSGGCTADYDFFDAFVELEDESFEEVINSYSRWYSIHDRPYLIKAL